MASKSGERGITFGDPHREHPASRITPLFVSLIRDFYFHNSSLRQAWLGFLKIKIPVRLAPNGSYPECGERGITFGDPWWEILATPNYSRLVSLAGLFVFNLSSLSQAWLGQFKNKKPTVNYGSNLELRREGDSNPRYPFGVHSLSRRAS